MGRDEVFISYRRSDTEASVTALRQSLEAAFGSEALFQDVTGIDPGDRWPQVLEDGLGRAGVVLVVIGPAWLRAVDRYGDRRLKLSDDWVAREVSVALADEAVTVIPVLVEGASMPTSDELARLPEGLRALGSRNSYRLEHATWNRDVGPLLEVIAKRLGRAVSDQALVTEPSFSVQVETNEGVIANKIEGGVVINRDGGGSRTTQ